MIEENLTPKEICSESGLIIKNGLELKLNYSRMVAPFKKAVRGIFFHHTGIPVPQGYVEMCGFLDTIFREWPCEVVRDINEIYLPALEKTQPFVLGPNVFSYRIVQQENDRNKVYMLMELYERFKFFGFTYKK